MAAVLKEMSECCMKIDGIMAFQYAIDEENKVNFLTEVYKDAAALGAMMKGTGEMRPKLFEAVKSPAVEERLLFESRWGSHTLKLTAGGKQLIEENTNGGARTILTWTLVEPAEGAAAAKPELKLW